MIEICQKELWKCGLNMKQKPSLGCYFSLHKEKYKVKVHMRNGLPRKGPATENEEFSRKPRTMTGVWSMGQRSEARGGAANDVHLRNLALHMLLWVMGWLHCMQGI